jgi:hypothetical protein
MRRAGAWGGELELHALSLVYRVSALPPLLLHCASAQQRARESGCEPVALR